MRQTPQEPSRPLQVLGFLRDRCGHLLEIVSAPYDGTADNALAVAKAILRPALDDDYHASGMESSFVATDAQGTATWDISTNCRCLDPFAAVSAPIAEEIARCFAELACVQGRRA